MKKAFISILLAGTMFAATTGALAAGIPVYKIDTQKQSVSIAAEVEANKSYSVQLFRPLGNGQYATEYINEIESNSDGKLNVDILLNNPNDTPADDEYYVFKLSDGSGQSEQECRFQFFSQAAIDERLKILSQMTTVEDYSDYLFANKYVFSFDDNLEPFVSLTQRGKEKTIEAMFKVRASITSVELINSQINENAAKQKVVDEYNSVSAKAWTDVDAFLKNRSSELSIELNDDYENNKQNICEKLLNDEANFIEDITDGYYENLIITTLNKLTKTQKDTITQMLTRYKDKINGIPAEFFNADKINGYIGYLNPGTYTTLASVAEDCKNAIDKYNQNTKRDNTSAGGSSGGSGGGGSWTTKPSIQVPANTDDASDQNQNPFADLDSFEWAADDIVKLYNLKIVSGKTDNIFDPAATVTRAEYVKMLTVAFGIYDASALANFSDTTGHWAEKYIASAYRAGIVSGMTDSYFGANESISRQDACVILYRAMKKIGKELKEVNGYEEFADKSDISDYAYDAVMAMKQAGIVSGMGENQFAPYETMNRAMAAKMIAAVVE